MSSIPFSIHPEEPSLPTLSKPAYPYADVPIYLVVNGDIVASGSKSKVYLFNALKS